MIFQKLKPLEKLGFLLLSLGGIGKMPKAPGTWGSLLSLIYLYFMPSFSLNINIFFFVALFILALYTTSYFEKKFKTHDPSWIVVDELLGLILMNLFFMTQNIKELILIFFFFRIFDIAKPWPVSWFDKKMNTPLGTLLDDLIAGVMAIIPLYLGQKFLESFL